MPISQVETHPAAAPAAEHLPPAVGPGDWVPPVAPSCHRAPAGPRPPTAICVGIERGHLERSTARYLKETFLCQEEWVGEPGEPGSLREEERGAPHMHPAQGRVGTAKGAGSLCTFLSGTAGEEERRWLWQLGRALPGRREQHSPCRISCSLGARAWPAPGATSSPSAESARELKRRPHGQVHHLSEQLFSGLASSRARL